MPRRCEPRERLLAAACVVAALLGLSGCGGGRPRGPDRPLSSVSVDGVVYTVKSARVLNAADPEDRIFLDGRRPTGGRTFVGLFIAMCNEAREPRRSAPQLRLRGPSGATASTVEPGDGRLAYEPVRLAPGECAPGPLSPAGRAARALAAVFELPEEAAPMRPLELVVESDAGALGRVRVVDVGE